jgi:hypothetical protein
MRVDGHESLVAAIQSLVSSQYSFARQDVLAAVLLMTDGPRA